jgi:hypothetical protein
MRTKVFAYKGVVGVESSYKAEGLINHPAEPGQLGFVVDANFVDISKEALDILKTIKRSSDDIGDIDIFAAKDIVCFCWTGSCKQVIKPDYFEGSNTYDPSLITRTCEVEVPEEFKTFIDGCENGTV